MKMVGNKEERKMEMMSMVMNKVVKKVVKKEMTMKGLPRNWKGK